MSKILTAMAMGCGLFLAGCATVGARQAPAPRVVATFDGHGMTAPNVALRRDGSSIRGNAYGRAVSLEWEGTDVWGSYWNLPVKLAVTPAGDAAQVDGEFFGESAAFLYTPRKIDGFLSGCAFLLESVDGKRFDGRRACPGKSMEVLTISFPEQLARRSEAERVAWMALLLTDETVEVPFARAQVSAGGERIQRPRMGACQQP
jgi:hypothetical protein